MVVIYWGDVNYHFCPVIALLQTRASLAVAGRLPSAGPPDEGLSTGGCRAGRIAYLHCSKTNVQIYACFPAGTSCFLIAAVSTLIAKVSLRPG